MLYIWNVEAVKRSVYFMLAVLVGVLSSGFSFYQMNCEKSCPTGIYFNNPHTSPNGCQMKKKRNQEASNNQKSCCHSSQKSTPEKEDDCCDIEKIFLKKDFEYSSSSTEISFFKDFDFSRTVIDLDQQILEQSLPTLTAYKGPPETTRLSGKNIRIKIQSLLFDFNTQS